VTAIPLSPPQKDIIYAENTGKPSIYLWNWLTLLYQKVNAPAGLTVVTGQFTCTLGGFSGAAPTGPINYTILGSNTTGGICSLSAVSVGISGTSNSSLFSLSGLPAVTVPATGSPIIPCFCFNGGGTVACEALVISGTVYFNPFKTTSGTNPQFVGPISSGWAASGSKGIQQGWTITYTLD
jgi:hypothetical protein